MTETRLQTRSITSAGGRTSMRLEPELWNALSEVCRREKVSTTEVIKAAEERFPSTGRTSAVRVYLLQYFRAAAAESGRVRSRHGNAGDMTSRRHEINARVR